MTALGSCHIPILAREVTEFLGCKPGGKYIDATLGGGGHAKMLLDASAPDGLLIGIDRDPDALNFAREHLKEFGERVTLVHGNFREMKQICHMEHIPKVDGILMDLGMSSDQLDHGHRGFSFKSPDDPLDMRMDPSTSLTAADILNQFPEEKIRDIIYRLGEERWASAIAKEITATRKNVPFRQVGDLISAIKRAIPSGARHGRRHMATKTFQALRIFVNKELESLEAGLQAGLSLLAPQGRMVIISFHSLEDRIVKQTFRDAEKNPEKLGEGRFRILTRRPIQPQEKEVSENPRARSAKLRVIERITA